MVITAKGGLDNIYDPYVKLWVFQQVGPQDMEVSFIRFKLFSVFKIWLILCEEILEMSET